MEQLELFPTKDIEETLAARGSRYGEYTQVAETAQLLKNVLHTTPDWNLLEYYMQESLDMICNKLSRIVNGDPFYDDNWHDVAGYSKLVEIEIAKVK